MTAKASHKFASSILSIFSSDNETSLPNLSSRSRKRESTESTRPYQIITLEPSRETTFTFFPINRSADITNSPLFHFRQPHRIRLFSGRTILGLSLPKLHEASGHNPLKISRRGLSCIPTSNKCLAQYVIQ